jgi:hypothetical protein
MNSSRKFFSTTITSLIALAIAPCNSQAAYVLTEVLDRPDPSQSNSLRNVAMTDDYLAIGAPSFSRPGKLGRIFLFDAGGEHLLQTLQDPQTRGFQSLTFGSGISVGGGHIVATDHLDLPNLIHVFDAASGLLTRTITSPISADPEFASGGAKISGDYIAVGTEAVQIGATGPHYPAEVDVYDANSGLLLHTLVPPNGAYQWGASVEISGTTIAIASNRPNDARVFFFDARTGDQLSTLQHPQISSFDTMTIQGDKLLLGQIRGSAFLLDTAGNLLQTFPSPGTDPNVSGAYFDFCGNNVLIGSFGSLFANTTVKPEAWLYDATTGQLLQKFSDSAPGDRFFDVDSNPSGSQIAIVRANGPSFGTQVWVYSSIPEPSNIMLVNIAVVSILLFSIRASRSSCIELRKR